jgi:putative tryptophan/tyrosine transport system substrate-binding protein
LVHDILPYIAAGLIPVGAGEMAIGRRQFISALGSAVVSWPLAARAQQPAPGKWRIAMLMPEPRQAPLREGLRELGYIEGQNLAVEWRFNDSVNQLAAFAVELVGLKPHIIAAAGTQAAQAAQKATKDIPIVMVASDPLGNGLVQSLAHPGGNITGLSLQSPEVSGKRLELLREISGKPTAIAVLYNPDDPPAVNALKETLDAATPDLKVTAVEARTPDELAPAFAKIAQAKPGALVILNSPLMSVQTVRIAEFALQSRLPTIYTDAVFAKAGGLMTYGPNFDAIIKGLAAYIDKILKGAKPMDLPVEQPTKFELVLNLKTAKALGLTVPPTLLALAYEVIE